MTFDVQVLTDDGHGLAGSRYYYCLSLDEILHKQYVPLGLMSDSSVDWACMTGFDFGPELLAFSKKVEVTLQK